MDQNIDTIQDGDAVPAKRVRKQAISKEINDEQPHRATTGNTRPKAKAKPNAAQKERQRIHHIQQQIQQQHQALTAVGPSVILLPSVTLSTYDKATQLTLSKDQLICHGCEGGYRMVRATHGVHIGSYYFEVEILDPAASDRSTSLNKSLPPSHVRVGWSTRQGELQAPVGFDQYSYGYRDIGGSKVHQSIRIDNYGSPFSVGDVIGCHIALFDDASLNKMSFFKNGVNQGVAYSGTDLPFGIYFPAVSMYMQASVRVNFGPSFIERPDIPGVNAVSELQPMNPEDRKMHEAMISAIKQTRVETQTRTSK